MRATLGATKGMITAIEDHLRYPTKLGSEIGNDALGSNMHRGLQAVLERVESAGPASPAAAVAAVKVATSCGSAGDLPGRCRSCAGGGDGDLTQSKLHQEQEEPA